MAAPKACVLDTSALFCLKDGEEGAAEVAKVLRKAKEGRSVYISFISLTEYFYIVYQERGRENAYRSYLELKMLPAEIVESNEPLRLLAGEIKALFSLSLADAWVAATAESLGAELLHKDPEFEALSDRLVLNTLPYKTKSK